MKHHELSRVCTMGDRLTAANHYAAEIFRSRSKELKGCWESLAQMTEERTTLLTLSISFHDSQQKVNSPQATLDLLVYTWNFAAVFPEG